MDVSVKFRIYISLLLVLVAGCQNVTGTMTQQIAPQPTLTTPTTTEIQPTEQPAAPTEEQKFIQRRTQMVEQQIAVRGIDDPEILNAMRNVPRHQFVPDDMVEMAYEDHPLPIGYGQTISQPYIVALMTQTISPEPGKRILEIGTGSGYQAAILAELGMDVFTIEIIPELAQQAADRLSSLGFTNVHTRTADGYFGWEEYAPFDAIMVTAAPDHLPQPLANQLAEGGRLVIPIGPIGFVQTLWLFEKVNGELQATNLGGVSFVPLTGEH